MEQKVRLFTIGIVLILAGWGIKHIFASLATYSLGTALKEASVEANRRAEIADETVDNEVAIAEERLKDSPDRQRINELEEQNGEVSMRIRKEYLVDEVEAEADAAGGGATALSLVRWFLRLKLLLDLVKIAGVFLVVWATLGLVIDEEAPSQVRWFAMAVSTVAMASILVGGVLSYLS